LENQSISSPFDTKYFTITIFSQKVGLFGVLEMTDINLNIKLPV
jgi:hypothetical protein